MMRSFIHFPLLLALFLVSACSQHTPEQEIGTARVGNVPKEPLVKINYIDQNGISETIVHPERLKQASQTSLLAPQPYKKLLRIYKKDQKGNAQSIITSYYDNGQIHQYLECVNSRASGMYCEWHENGQKKLEACVMAGVGDLSEQAIESFAFQGEALAWTEKGDLSARCQYEGGKLSGTSYTYYANKTVASKTSWKDGLQCQIATRYDRKSNLIESTSYENGKREGLSEGYHLPNKKAFEERYEGDLLQSGTYFLPTGEIVSQVNNGWGIRSIFSNGILTTQHEVENGKPEGKVSLFDAQGRLERTYYIRTGKKQGMEIWYLPSNGQKRQAIQWSEDEIQGLVQTWYSNGIMESSKEYCHNQKQGLTTCWYRDGSIMLVEEYVGDKLKRGTYHRKGSSEPVSRIENGSGTATLFDAEGNLIEAVVYRDCFPELKE